MTGNPLVQLRSFGQSIWLDFIRRGMLVSGELRRLIDDDGVAGVTSNPAIFEKAIIETDDYDDAIRALVRQGKSAAEIYDELTVEDIRRAADLFRPLYHQTDGRDGFVSIEVSPRLAHDSAATIAESRRLWTKVGRPNVMIKVPGTREGLPAIRHLIAEGINVNVTLLFGLPRYRAVTDAYLAGLEDRVARGMSLVPIASVASFFLSRIDVLVDPLLEKKEAEGGPATELAAACRGEVAIACAKAAYQMFKEVFGGEHFRRLAGRGARPQRLLWASTGTKNPAYTDVKYVEPLIGPQTVNTLPLGTLAAYRDHGVPAPRLEEGVADAQQTLERLTELGINLARVAQQLEDEGIENFVKPFDAILERLKEKQTSI